ncbi:ParB/RepB/Spo0J family partition protein [Leucobacter ruminantium]|uniref:Chromosome partitioning protein, ParB family n=1 Tax=Leucobacter ruminantium TaxID=1289170 RepID=A0A939LU82_9MICO|nr:ParB N-terminal domain-containing protein [Leucobacter ruminantium]MBO1804477.1 hypothetical protein [Leucobacter ruminantium]
MSNATLTQAPAVELRVVDAREVVVDANIRANTKIDRGFVALIKRYGVMVPLLGHLTEDGRVKIEDGQRRILGAIEAERYEVPVYIVPENDTEARRIVRQLIANDARAELDEGERVAAWQQLELEGMSATAIARAVGEKPKRIKAGLSVAANSTATEAVKEYQMTFDQALILAEFEDDAEAVEKLRHTAAHSPGQFEHVAQRLRDLRAEQAQIDAVVAQYTSQGFIQIDHPSYDDKDTLRVSDLSHADGSDITEEDFPKLPGFRFAVSSGWQGVRVVHYVTDWKADGLKRRRSDGTAVTPWTEEEKAERKRLVANNKAWRSAEVVRREWLTSFLVRKTTPKQAQKFIATSVIDGRGLLSRSITEHHRLATSLLGLPDYQWGTEHPILTHITKQPARIRMVMLAMTIAAHEEATGTHTWRNPGTEMRDYFTALSEWGYPLSDVENIVIGIDPATAESDAGDDADAAESDREASDTAEADAAEPEPEPEPDAGDTQADAVVEVDPSDDAAAEPVTEVDPAPAAA